MRKLILIGITFVTLSSARAAEVVVQAPLSDVRRALTGLYLIKGAIVVNNSADHPAFEYYVDDWNGVGSYFTYRYKLTSCGESCTKADVTVELWIERKAGSYPDTERARPWNEFMARDLVLEQKKAERATAYMLTEQNDEHNEATILSKL